MARAPRAVLANADALAFGPVGAPPDALDREQQAFVEDQRNLTTEVRESVSRAIQATVAHPVAAWLEALVTWVSGCPHRGQQPLFERTVAAYTIEAFGGFVGGCVLGHYAVVHALWWLLPLAWLIVAGRTWALFALFHHRTHGNLFASELANRVTTRVISLVTFASSFSAYEQGHIKSHHAGRLCRLDDEEGAFVQLGFPPGRTKRYYWGQLLRTLLLPNSYLKYVKYRLWDWQKSESLSYRLLTWGFAAALVVGAHLTGSMPSLVLAYVVPLFVVFNATGVLGTFSEHHWGCLADHDSSSRRIVLLCQGRYLLDEAPSAALTSWPRWQAWAVWWARLLLYHVPVRVAVLPGDSLHHDHHHRHAYTETWTHSTYERADHIWNGCPGFPNLPHTHAWSLGEAIDRVFTRMAAARAPAQGPTAQAQDD